VVKKSVLILGGTGRMSSKLTALCISKGYDVTISVRGKHKVSDDIVSVKKIILDRFDEKAVRAELEDRFFNIVFDCSGYLPQCVDWVLSSIKTDRYIYISSIATYVHYYNGCNLCEEGLPILDKTFETDIKVGDRGWYARGKYNSECLIANKYSDLNYAIVRIPFVMSLEDDDYDDKLSSRILRYVLKIVAGMPICEKNINRHFNFSENTDEARFLLFLSETSFKGVINFASQGSVTMQDIIQYTEEKLGKKAIVDANAEILPFTTHPEVTMDLSRCMALGYIPLKLDNWLWQKIDKYIDYSERIEGINK
jgi:nucleoside-diphosphate-sugar epimerase